MSGRPGAAYVGVPSNILFGPAPASSAEATTSGLHIPALGPNRLLRERIHADGAAVQEAAHLLAKAQRHAASYFEDCLLHLFCAWAVICC